MMRMMLIGMIALSAMAQTKSTKPAARPPAEKQTAASPLPAGAEQVREGVWRFKDSSGKTWIYTKTPFGYTRELEGKRDDSPAAPNFHVVAIEGDTVKFERSTPFGKTVWTRNISELDEREKAVYEAKLQESQKSQQ